MDTTLCKQCTFHVNNSILNQHTLKWENTFAHNGRELVHRNNHPSTNPILGPNHHYYCTPSDCTCMLVVKKGRRLENKKNSLNENESTKVQNSRHMCGLASDGIMTII